MSEAPDAERTRLVGVLQGGPSPILRTQAAERLRELGSDLGAFKVVAEYARGKELAQRDDSEQAAVLETLGVLGGIRAVRVLEELAGRGGLLASKGTRRLGALAKERIERLRAEQRTPVEATPPGLCARCRFQNVAAAQRCLQCGGQLQGGGGGGEVGNSTVVLPPPPTKFPASDEGTTVIPLLSPRATGAPTPSRAPSPGFRRDQAQTQRFKPLGQGARLLPDVPADDESDELDFLRDGSALAWLWCKPLKAVPVLPDDVVRIGRSRTDCQLVLAHESVSRTHVLIRALGGQIHIEDRSSYGTWVNGERVAQATIRPGDVITIGPYDVVVTATKAETEDEEGTRPLRTFASSEAIGGRLERVSLAEVLQQIEFNQKTGTLEVFDDGRQGVLVVYEGRPMFAELGELRDEAAVISMLRLKRGNFSFRAKVTAGEMSMSVSLTQVLLEASRLEDEG